MPTSRPTARWRLVVAVLVVAALAPACDPGGSGDDGEPYRGMHLALCTARDATDPDVTELTFQRSAHPELHALADEVSEVDRAAAAELLVSKNQVEQRLQTQAPHDQVTDAIASLIAPARRASQLLGHAPPDC